MAARVLSVRDDVVTPPTTRQFPPHGGSRSAVLACAALLDKLARREERVERWNGLRYRTKWHNVLYETDGLARTPRKLAAAKDSELFHHSGESRLTPTPIRREPLQVQNCRDIGGREAHRQGQWQKQPPQSLSVLTGEAASPLPPKKQGPMPRLPPPPSSHCTIRVKPQGLDLGRCVQSAGRRIGRHAQRSDY